MSLERFPVPRWIVVGSGTGGTSATIGRYLRYRRHDSCLAVVDPENSAFLPGWRDADAQATTGCGSRIEGIGRPRVEPSFLPGVVDRMIAVPDAASVAMVRALEPVLGRKVGASTGTNLWGVLKIAAQMQRDGAPGSIVTLLCDGGERYAHTYFDDDWLTRAGISPDAYAAEAARLVHG